MVALFSLIACSSDSPSNSSTDPDTEPSNNSQDEPIPPSGKPLEPTWPGADDLEWEFNPDTRKLTVPAISSDEQLLFVGGANGTVYAVDRQGDEKWSKKTGRKIEAAPGVAGDRVYVASWDGTLYALDASDGTELWRFETDKPIDQSPSIAEDGTVYVVSEDETLYALAPGEGRVEWSVSLPAPATTPVTILSADDSQQLVVGTTGGQLHCISDGQIDNSLELEGDPSLEIAAASGSQKLLVVGTTQGVIHGANFDCSSRWSTDITWAEMGGPSISETGFYIGAHDDHLRFVTFDGVEQWAKPVGHYSPLHRTPTVYRDGSALAAAGTLTRADSSGETSTLSRANLMGGPVVDSSTGPYGILTYGRLVRLDLPSSVPGDRWFTQHGNYQRTSRLDVETLE